MFDKTTVSKRLSALARQVESYDNNAATRLRTLSGVIEMEQDTHAWETTDLYHLINPDSILESYREQRKNSFFIRFLEMARNVLIFVPITLTWIAIWQASIHYNEMIQTLVRQRSDQINLPFLYLWQRGFDGTLPDIFKLGNVALLDVLVLLLIMLFTFFAHWFPNKREDKIRVLYTELVHAIGEVSFYLASHRLTNSDNLEKIARKIETMSKDTLTSMADLAKQLSIQLGDITTETAKKLEILMENIITSFSKVSQESIEQFKAFTQQATSSLDTISERMDEQMDLFTQHTQKQFDAGTAYINQLGQLAGGTKQLSQDLEATSRALQSSSGDISTRVTELVGTIAGLSAQQKDLHDVVKTSAEHLTTSSVALSDLRQKQVEWSTELHNTFSQLKTAVERTATLTTTLEDQARHQISFLDQLKLERDAQTKQTGQVINAAENLKNALDAMNNGTVEVRRLAIDMNDIIRLQAAIPKTLKGDLAEIVQGHTGAAQALESSANTLAVSAQAINKAVNEVIHVQSTIPTTLKAELVGFVQTHTSIVQVVEACANLLNASSQTISQAMAELAHIIAQVKTTGEPTFDSIPHSTPTMSEMTVLDSGQPEFQVMHEPEPLAVPELDPLGTPTPSLRKITQSLNDLEDFS